MRWRFAHGDGGRQLLLMSSVASPRTVHQRTFNLPAVWPRWSEHGFAIVLYTILSILLSWPTAEHFTTRITSSGVDAKHNLWLYWHVQQAVLGKQALFEAPLLYYPKGISLFTHGVGPLTGLFALPFWPFGPEAAYNGALLICLLLSGYFSYLLARDLGFGQAEALFCGMMVLSAPMCLGGLTNHVTKVFLGAQPILLLLVQRMLDLKRSFWWAIAPAPALLLVLLHNGYQFVFSAFAVMFFWGAAFVLDKADRRELFRRGVIFAASCVLFVLPMLIAISIASNNPEINVDANADSRVAPDLAQYLLPVHHSLLFGDWTRSILSPYGDHITMNLETAVSLSLAGLVLCAVAFARAGRMARRWVVFAAFCIIISLGPSLHILAREEFTEYKLPIILPYAFLTALPGLDFMRAPGRWMMMGFVCFAVAATWGLSWLTTRFPRYRGMIIAAAAALVLLEVWPQPFPQETLPKIPEFYKQIANDPDEYGVFDLPIKESRGLSYNGWSYFYTSSIHQIFQITHGKGIVAGYISRTYSRHPVFGELLTNKQPMLFIDGRPAKFVTFQDDLLRQNYRYVVLHKDLFGKGPDVPGYKTARELIADVFGSTLPYVDDQDVTVYKLAPATDSVQLHWGTNWRSAEDEWRWAASPATLLVESPTPRQAVLEITPAHIHDAAAEGGLGPTGMLTVQVGNTFSTTVQIAVDQPVQIPIELAGGSETITLSLQAGNFAPEGADLSEIPGLSFAVRSINLRTK